MLEINIVTSEEEEEKEEEAALFVVLFCKKHRDAHLFSLAAAPVCTLNGN